MLRRITIFRLFVILVIAVPLAPIAASPQNIDQASPQAAQEVLERKVRLEETQPSVIHIFRRRKYAASALSVDVSCDTEFVGQSKNGKYLTLRVPPGQHIITSSGKSISKTDSVEIDVVGGGVYYIQLAVDVHPKVTMVVVSKEVGEAEIRGLKAAEDNPSSTTSVTTLAKASSTTNPADVKVPLNAVIVLTPELCTSTNAKGSYWRLGKDTFFTGKVFCSGIEPSLRGTFSNLSRIPDAASTGEAQLVLIPRFVSVSEKMHLTSTEVVTVFEWTAKDAAGKTVWIETVEGHGEANKRLSEVFTASMNDFFAQSVSKMSSSPELLKLADKSTSATDRK